MRRRIAAASAATRGATLLEYILSVGAIALVALGGARFLGERLQAKARAEAACIENLDCGSADPAGVLASDAPSAAGEAKAERGPASARLKPALGAAVQAATLEPPKPTPPSPEDIRDPFSHTSVEPHRARVLHDGADSLLTRLEEIDQAKSSIDIAMYELSDGSATRLVLQALKEAAGRGVQVRFVMDRYLNATPVQPKPILYKELAMELERAGIAVRYYNMAPKWKPLARTRRLHQKTMVVDGRRLVTGGRNLTDDYFDLDYTGFSYMDRDVLVEGPGVEATAQTFDALWRHDWTVDTRTAFQGEPIDDRHVARAKSTLTPDPKDAETRKRVEEAAQKARAATGTVTAPRVTYASDQPGPAGAGVMRCHGAVMEVIRQAQKSVVIESYDFFPGADTERELADLIKKGVRVSLVTNSRLTEQQPEVAAFGLESQKRLVEAGGDVFVLGGWESPGHADPRASGTPTTWYDHAKTVVVDSSEVVYGSFNFDPRSRNINMENVVVLHDVPELAAESENAIWQHAQASYKVDADGKLVGAPQQPHDAQSTAQRILERLRVELHRPFRGQY